MGWIKRCIRDAILLVLLAFVVQLVLDLYLRREYKVHEDGVIVISGTSTGIGRHAAFELAKKGYTVFCGVRSEKDIVSLDEEAKALGLEKRVRAIIMDVVNVDQVEAAVKEVDSFLSKTGLPMVGIINNAGISMHYPVETIPLADAKYIFDVHVFGSITMTQKFLPLIRKHRGRILFISSLSATVSLYGAGIYAASKRAIEGLVDSLRMEMYPFGVSVTSVAPGYIKTARAYNIIPNYRQIIPTALYDVYESFFTGLQESRSARFRPAPGPEVTSEDIVDAITNPYPRTRYYPGSAVILPIELVPILVGIFPDRLVDLIKPS